jgi:putative flippase GtrA
VRRLRLLAQPLFHWSTIRFGVAGAIAAVVYLGLPVALNGAAGVPVQLAIPLAYVTAVIVQFNLQRHFVFRHVAAFALTQRAQVGRYLMIGAVQYPVTAIATALLPSVLHTSERATFVVVALAMSLVIFVVLRTHIFHETRTSEDVVHTRSWAERNVAEENFRRRRRRGGEREADPIQTPVK